MDLKGETGDLFIISLGSLFHGHFELCPSSFLPMLALSCRQTFFPRYSANVGHDMLLVSFVFISTREVAAARNPIDKIQEGRCALARSSLTSVVEYQKEPKPLWSDVERAGGAQKLGPR